jgi:AI-2 transport protein TqsA
MEREYPEEAQRHKTITALLVVVTLILTGAALRATAVVTLPLVIAVFLAILVQPIQRSIAGLLPDRLRWLGVLGAMLAILAVFTGIAGALWLSVEMVSEKAPAYGETFEGYWQQAKDWAQAHHLPIEEEFLDVETMRQEMMRLAGIGLTSVLGFASALVLIFFLVLLLLIESHEWKVKSAAAFDHSLRRSIVDTVHLASIKVRQWLYIRTVVSIISGVLGGLWLWIMGVDFAPLWGFMIFLLNFLPHIGSIVAIFPPALLALVQFGWSKAVIVIIGYTVIEQVIGNFVDPLLQGRKLTISPVVVLIALVFWGWVWGIPGALLAVPIMTTIMVVCAHTETLRPVAQLLGRTGDEEEMEQLNGEG